MIHSSSTWQAVVCRSKHGRVHLLDIPTNLTFYKFVVISNFVKCATCFGIGFECMMVRTVVRTGTPLGRCAIAILFGVGVISGSHLAVARIVYVHSRGRGRSYTITECLWPVAARGRC